MALDTLDNLVKTVIAYTKRGDLGVFIPDFITLAETEMFSNPDASLKLNQAEKVLEVQTVVDSRFLPLPTGFQSSRRFKITINDRSAEIKYRTPDQLNIKSDVGAPCFFTITGENIEFDIVPDIQYTITITYFEAFAPLTTLNQTNIVLDKYPNIYLFGCLRHAFIYAQDAEQEAFYTANVLSAITSANKAERDSRYGPTIQTTARWAP